MLLKRNLLGKNAPVNVEWKLKIKKNYLKRKFYSLKRWEKYRNQERKSPSFHGRCNKIGRGPLP